MGQPSAPPVVFLCHESCGTNGGIFHTQDGVLRSLRWQADDSFVDFEQNNATSLEVAASMWPEWGKFEKTCYPGQEIHRAYGIQNDQSTSSAESSSAKTKKEKRELPNKLSFSGKVAIVTGGGRGAGRAHCLMLSERGAKVLVNDKAKDKADEVVAAIKAKGGEAAPDYNDIASAGEAVV